MNKVIVLAVHPDDETLGCGGTLLKHKANGGKIYWLIATSMKTEDGFKRSKILECEKDIKTVTDMYGFDGVYRLHFPTTRIDRFSMVQIIDKISNVLSEVKPNIIYLPFCDDLHSDHRIIFEAAYSGAKLSKYPFIKKILMMETISETELAPSLKEFVFAPNYFVDISDFLDKKLSIMAVFKSEIGDHPFPRSLENIEALATFRGAMAGCKYAEAFMLLRDIQ